MCHRDRTIQMARPRTCGRPHPRTTCPPSSLLPGCLQAFGGVAKDAQAVAGAGEGSVGRLRTENRATRRVQSSSLMAPSRAGTRATSKTTQTGVACFDVILGMGVMLLKCGLL